MPHDTTLITTVAAGFGLALVLGILAEKLKLPALVGYLLAGIAIGPATPGYVADMGTATQLAELGVMLLMFGVGLRFSLDNLLSVKRVALPGAIAQMTVATLLGMAIAGSWGWGLGSSLVFGLSLSVASTVVLLKALEARGILESMNGYIAVGWLVVEDLAMVVVLVLLPPLAGILGGTETDGTFQPPLWRTLGLTLLQVGAFVALMLIVGRRVMPWMLWQVARTGSRELFTLAVIAAAITIAFGAAELFGVSFALGAFFAGMVMRESTFSHRAAEESLPLRDAFAVLFFVSVGMLFEPGVLIENPLRLIGVVAIIIIGKSVAAAVLVIAFHYPLSTAFTVAASLAQIGEFSFILAGLGMSLGLLTAEGQSLILAGALISIALNPMIFGLIEPLRSKVLENSSLARQLDRRRDPFAELPASTEERYLEGQVVLVGYGRVGQQIGEALRGHAIPFVVVEHNRELVESLRKQDIAAVSGNAAEPSVLIQAHIARAAMLVVAIPDTLDVHKMTETARTLNPDIEVAVRAQSEDDARLLAREAVDRVFFGDDELAKGMANHILKRFAPPPGKGANAVARR
ncbi:YbaL family putative K(+) efflux transporter [Halomonas sp. M4R5S39]|uniref:YbaL family putative K(+) efflux transporter n=1 Tax=Halomonas kalidii TaxID=3043293 RepID=UPI0024A9863D|nr:YbaL family putative K(+) efflux transporter [Halomonas kalidii]MDI5983279.1 YbaL family putative K(+) efflux transporter [Halomonas kalidii]